MKNSLKLYSTIKIDSFHYSRTAVIISRR